MDHAINDLKGHLTAFMDVYAEEDTFDVMNDIAAYVNALRILETQYYGEAKTGLAETIQRFERSE